MIDVEEAWPTFKDNNTLEEYLQINYGVLKLCNWKF